MTDAVYQDLDGKCSKWLIELEDIQAKEIEEN